MPDPKAVVDEVREYGFCIWPRLVPAEVVRPIPGIAASNLRNWGSYVSIKFSVLKLDILPQPTLDACIPPEIDTVFTEALGAHKMNMREIYVTHKGRYKPHPWHQDANAGNLVYHFMVWIAATHCGKDSPGLSFAVGNPGRYIGDEIQTRLADVVSPVFAPGDAVFFDCHSIHRTHIEPTMQRDRVAYKLGARAK